MVQTKPSVRKVIARLLLPIMSVVAGLSLAQSQSYPSKPIRLIVPFPPGGSSDLVARSYSQKLGEELGQQIIVDFRAGAGGAIGTAEAARAVPDGYTLLQVWDSHAANHHLIKVQYDFTSSFVPISLLVKASGALVSHPGFASHDVRALIDFAKMNPGKVTYGSAGNGSSNHLAAVSFGQLSGVKMTHVPYKGGGPMVNDLIAGHVNIGFGTLPFFAPYIKSGQLKIMATTGIQRSPQFLDVPTVGETVPSFESSTWFGLLAPSGTPEPVLARLRQALAKAFGDNGVRNRLEGQGFDVVASTSDFLGSFLVTESNRIGKLIHDEDIKSE